MMDTNEVRSLLYRVFEEMGLVIGGLTTVHREAWTDDFLWRLMRCLDVIRRKAFREVVERRKKVVKDSQEAPPPESVRLRPHPAIVTYMERLRASRTTPFPPHEKGTLGAE
jgi:hypothetical protein